jgi:hypothetical protein
LIERDDPPIYTDRFHRSHVYATAAEHFDVVLQQKRLIYSVADWQFLNSSQQCDKIDTNELVGQSVYYGGSITL